jgi:hypothetical protein
LQQQHPQLKLECPMDLPPLHLQTETFPLIATVSLDLLIDHMGGVGRALHHFPGSLLTANLTGGARSIQSRTAHMEVLLEDLLLESGYCRATRIIFTILCLPRGCRRSCEGYFSHRCVYVYISRELFVSREIEIHCRRDLNGATNVLGG